MAKQQKHIYEKKARGPGRPQLYSEPILIRLSVAVLKSVEQWAKQHGTTRNEALRRLVERGLKQKD